MSRVQAFCMIPSSAHWNFKLLTHCNNALYRNSVYPIDRLEYFDSPKYLFSQNMTEYFLAKLPSKLLIAPIRGNTVLVCLFNG